MRSIICLLVSFVPFVSLGQMDEPRKAPPGTISLNDSLYVDQHELSNIDWLEYMYWNKRIFGSGSAEYLKTLPDTTVWSTLGDSLWCYELLTDVYLRHPSYRNHPITGISKEQAAAYTQWRSDRVFEYLLIEQEVISRDTAQQSGHFFTIQSFFDGSYLGEKPEAGAYYVPNYRLMTSQDISAAHAYNESKMERYRRKLAKRGDFCDEREDPYIFEEWIQCGTFEMEGMTGSSTVEPFPTDDCDCKKDVLFFLKGNLPEITEASSDLPHFVTFRNAAVWRTVFAD